MENGFFAGYPIVDIEIDLYDGKYHPVDSKDIAYQMAGSKALKAAFESGGVELLEPIYEMQIIVPEENMGDIMGDLSSRRGRIMGSETIFLRFLRGEKLACISGGLRSAAIRFLRPIRGGFWVTTFGWGRCKK